MRIKAIASLLTLGLASTASGSNALAPKPRVIGGKEATAGSFSFIGQLSVNIPGVPIKCIATLISPRVAITSGTCALVSSSDATVTFASPLSSSTDQKPQFNVSRIVTQPLYDIPVSIMRPALVFLDKPVPSTVATPVKIYTGEYSTKDTLTFAGYKTANKDDHTVSNTVSWYNTALAPNSVCTQNTNYSIFKLGYLLCSNVNKDNYWYKTKIDYYIRPAYALDMIAKAAKVNASDISTSGNSSSVFNPSAAAGDDDFVANSGLASGPSTAAISKNAGSMLAPSLAAILGLAATLFAF
ncbi:hypothetical protein GGI12_004898 [Dipsacomyces acuminosporus]|nr:hypothetical protein GGI12_004898 [Dipsacomyces acuminosporus]